MDFIQKLSELLWLCSIAVPKQFSIDAIMVPFSWTVKMLNILSVVRIQRFLQIESKRETSAAMSPILHYTSVELIAPFSSGYYS